MTASTAAAREPTSVAWGWSLTLTSRPSSRKKSVSIDCCRHSSRAGERAVRVACGRTVEQLAHEWLQADVELREVGGRQALALRDPRVEEHRDGLRRVGCRSSPPRPPRARPVWTWSARLRTRAAAARARPSRRARIASSPGRPTPPAACDRLRSHRACPRGGTSSRPGPQPRTRRPGHGRGCTAARRGFRTARRPRAHRRRASRGSRPAASPGPWPRLGRPLRAVPSPRLVLETRVRRERASPLTTAAVRRRGHVLPLCYMAERVGVRELRQNLSRWLRRVESGESFEVTDRGRPVAQLIPLLPEDDVIARLVREGRIARVATRGLADLPTPLPPRPGARPLSEILDELREDTV